MLDFLFDDDDDDTHVCVCVCVYYRYRSVFFIVCAFNNFFNEISQENSFSFILCVFLK